MKGFMCAGKRGWSLIKSLDGEGGWKDWGRLWDALHLDAESNKIISCTGAGGKTSVMFRLAEELKEMGKRVIVTTSTHIFYPDDYQVEVIESAEALERVVWRDRILVVGGEEEKVLMGNAGVPGRKLKGMDVSSIGRLSSWCDVLLIEADGSRRMPLKVPADHEPVIIPDTDTVLGCAGLTCVGKTWEEGCFRPELAGKLLLETGKSVKRRIRPGDVACILTSCNGTRKQVENRTYRIVLNQADDAEALDIARLIAGEAECVELAPVVVTSRLYERFERQ